MANILADIGRANIGETAIQGIRGIAAIQGLQTQKQQQAIQAYQYKQMMEQEERMNRKIDITAHPMFLQLPDQVKPQVLNFFASSGFTDPKGVGEMRNIVQGIQMIEGTKDTFQGFMGPVVEAKKQKYIETYNALQDELAKGTDLKGKKVLTLQAQLKKSQMDYESSSGNFQKHLDRLDEIEAAKKQSVSEYGKWLRDLGQTDSPENRTEYMRMQGKGKSIERTIDLGDKVEIHYTDGTVEAKRKGVPPATAEASGRDPVLVKEWKADNLERRKKGLPERSLEDFMKLKKGPKAKGKGADNWRNYLD